MKRRMIVVLALALLGADLLAGRAAGGGARVVVAGSSCMGRMMSALAESYDGARVEVQLGGTQLGLQSLRQGVADLASCSRALTARENDLTATLIARDAIAVAVHQENMVDALTAAQLRDLYEGRVENWRTLGGPDLPVVAIGREAGSGTREAFEQALGIASPRHAQELCETGMVRTAVAQTPGAIGYLSAEYIGAGVKAVAVDGVLPTPQAVTAGSYPLTRPLLLCLPRGDGSDEARAFLQYAAGPAGQAVVAQLGMVPARPAEQTS